VTGRLVYTLHLWPALGHARHYTGKPESSGFLKVSRRLSGAGFGELASSAQVTRRAGRIYPAGLVRR
jgi:hypothetical protein